MANDPIQEMDPNEAESMETMNDDGEQVDDGPEIITSPESHGNLLTYLHKQDSNSDENEMLT